MKRITHIALLYILTTFSSYAQHRIEITPLDTCYATHTKITGTKLWLPIAGVVAAGFALDQTLSIKETDIAMGNHGLSYMGEAKVLAPVAVAMTLTGWALKNQKLTLTSNQSLEAMVGAAAITSLLKVACGRARPYTEEGPNSYYPFSHKGDNYRSMPSGHATMAFAFFTPLAENYSRWFYLAPIAVAAQRVWTKQHWPSDVIVASAIGWGVGYLLAHKKSHRIGFSPNGICIYI
ncbi:phosphatase PAP2 family protein [Halosquirtibacter laminarini]|uniref:Phosphatase PAP2 family protein n=1 Tax=Halosquirtibacter laminarini TaxID=3374600 RepID=A0AC61NN56_9BACT|nr:phosphatase PAP2 family protein [Prolixibacteraceae bacterium]